MPGRCRKGKEHPGRENKHEQGHEVDIWYHYVGTKVELLMWVKYRYKWECIVEVESRKEMWDQLEAVHGLD